MKRIKGRPVCATVYDARGRAHLLSPVRLETVCGRELEPGGKPTLKVCFACAELASSANAALRVLRR